MSENGDVTTFDRPFWIRPPWAVLFDLVKLQRIQPWTINLHDLLTTLMREMTEKGYIDFSASGIALLSPSIIYRLKSELILELQEPPKPPPEKPMEFLPPPLQLPYRFEYTSTTIESLITALEEMMKEETTIQTAPQPTPLTPDPFLFRQLDDFMIDIENKIHDMYLKVLSLLKENKVLGFSKLIHGLKKIEKIRAFLLILFLATREQILLQQTEELGEIYISLPLGE